MNLAIGEDRKFGNDWITCGIEYGDIIGDVRALPFASDSFDCVYISHVIEHVWWYEVEKALSEIWRVLRPEGAIEIWTLDFDKIIHAYSHKQCGDQWRKYNSTGDYFTWLNGRIFAYGNEANTHRSCHTPSTLSKHLKAVGFTKIERLTTPRGVDHGPLNFGLTATKC